MQGLPTCILRSGDVGGMIVDEQDTGGLGLQAHFGEGVNRGVGLGELHVAGEDAAVE